MIPINQITIPVEKIRSYQTLIYKNGSRTFPKAIYKRYKAEMKPYIQMLRPIRENVPIVLELTLNAKGGYEKEKHQVRLHSTGNISKSFATQSEAKAYMNDKHYLDFKPHEIKYGVLPDIDNAMKPIIDYMEELGIIDNDRYVVETIIKKTFGNKEETIDLKIYEAKTIIENGRAKFEREKYERLKI